MIFNPIIINKNCVWWYKTLSLYSLKATQISADFLVFQFFKCTIIYQCLKVTKITQHWGRIPKFPMLKKEWLKKQMFVLKVKASPFISQEILPFSNKLYFDHLYIILIFYLLLLCRTFINLISILKIIINTFI